MTYLGFPRLSATYLVHVWQPCCFVVLALWKLYIDVLVPGSLFVPRCRNIYIYFIYMLCKKMAP